MSEYVHTPPAAQVAPAPAGAGSDEAALVRRCKAQWQEGFSWLAPARTEALEDRAIYDGDGQWPEKVKRARELDNKPTTAINVVGKAVDNMGGKERANRYSWKVLPIGDADVRSASAMTKCLAYLADVTKAKYAMSLAADDARKGPFGVLEVGLDDANPARESLFVKQGDPFEWVFDPYTRQPDLSDCRYMVKFRQVDLDLAEAAFPEKAEQLRALASASRDPFGPRARVAGDYGNAPAGAGGTGENSMPLDVDPERERVLLREHHWWVNEPGDFFALPDGRVYDWTEAIARPDFFDLVQAGGKRRKGTKRCFYVTVVCGDALISHQKSEYPFERFPAVIVWCYRDRNGLPYGVIRRMRDPQRSLNVAFARFNEAARSRWAIWKKGALGNTRAADVARRIGSSTFTLEVAQPENFQIGSDKGDAQLWDGMMDRAASYVDDTSGQNEASYGDKSPETSGIAIQTKVAQQMQNLGIVFDYVRLARLLVGEMLLALFQKFTDPAKAARILETAVRRDGQQDELAWLAAGGADPIGQAKYDVAIEDQAETATERRAMMELAVQLVGMAEGPQRAKLLPGIVRMSDFENKEEMAAALEEVFAVMFPAPAPPPMGGDPGVPPDLALGPPPGDPGLVPPTPPAPPAGGLPVPPEMAV